ncbi:MAG: sigma-54 interaction domain-containing protein [Gemmatimonadaceae bacterium]
MIAPHRVDVNVTVPDAAEPDQAKSAPTTRVRVLATGNDDVPHGRVDLQGLEQWAHDGGADYEFARDLPRAARHLAGSQWDIVLAVLGDRPEEELSWWVDALRSLPGAPRLVALVQSPSMRLALHAEKIGVLDLLSLPLQRADFLAVLERHSMSTGEEIIPLSPPAALSSGGTVIIGRHRTMLGVYTLMARAAQSTATVLLQGESGTGKEIVARSIHENGLRPSGPFIAVNCAAIPENLLESELFGHEKGAFTGAVGRRTGRFELAIGGTLFLDEVGDMSLALQAKILRAVQEREIERVGGEAVIPVDVRVVAATNRNLRECVEQGTFREDLYYRLAVLTIKLPRLAERSEDLIHLASYFVRYFAPRYGKDIQGISDRAHAAMLAHRWPGNVRELRNAIEHAVLSARGQSLLLEDLPEEIRGTVRDAGESALPGREQSVLATLAETEVRQISRALAQTGGVITSAAEILGIHRNTLTRKIKGYGL